MMTSGMHRRPFEGRHLVLLWLPPSITGEVYSFPRRQLIFRFDRRVIYHLKVFECSYIPKLIPSVRLYHDF